MKPGMRRVQGTPPPPLNPWPFFGGTGTWPERWRGP
jgi:hypothetical protein